MNLLVLVKQYITTDANRMVKRNGEMNRSQLSEIKVREKENGRLSKIVAEPELDKLILKESLDYLKLK